MRKKQKKITQKRAKKKSGYSKASNKLFAKFSRGLSKGGTIKSLKRDLIEANLNFTPAGYMSLTLFTTTLAVIISLLIFLFFMFLNLSLTPPYPTISIFEGSYLSRFLKIFWIPLAIPIGTFLLMYLYPSLEKKSVESKINQELPFATIHMSAISGSMIDPTKIFSIIISTKEYPYIEKEFTKLVNEINIYGYNLVAALRDVAFNTPSSKLSELFNGLATTITSGGDLPEFFAKRSQTLLFDHKLEREKYTRSAETFMDIYISVVIAAPMIFMLLLMMMKISGLGVSLSTSMIAVVMVLGVSLINFVFLVFLHLKQSGD
jgi:flagellar protein FlaJ